jgi:hypothetical protein
LVATNNRYFDGVAAFAEAASSDAQCVAASVGASVSSTHERVRSLRLPRAVDWVPEPQFCEQRLSGWRHAGVLKTQLIVKVLRLGFDCLIADADWRPTTSFVSVLVRLHDELGWDVVGTPDESAFGAQLLNIGLLWLRNTHQVRRIGERAANRTFGAWDQMIVNQEVQVAADSVACCSSTELLQSAFVRGSSASHAVNDHAKLEASAQESCTGPRPQLDALPPPAGCGGPCANVYPHWVARGFNEITQRQTSRCVNLKCADGAPRLAPPLAVVTKRGFYAPARNCDHRLSAWCAADATCDAGDELVPRFDVSAWSNGARAWRCYARHVLTEDGISWDPGRGQSYCTRPALADVLTNFAPC